jgi:hypothetical protein
VIENIPQELKALPQWVAAGEDKVPINPRNGRNADPTNRETWGTFVEAKRTGLKHIGFVLSEEDPYTIIDLDDPFLRANKTRIEPGDPEHDEAVTRVTRHAKFLELFDSYTEISQSGQGMHVVVKGRIPKGVRRDKVEIYSSERYMIFTGHIYKDAPIQERQELLDAAFREMDSTAASDLVELTGPATDEEVVRMAMAASNADKFNALCRGAWQEMGIYESQSEADLALMTIFAYYTRDNEQVRRLFRYSALGRREKAHRDDYLNYAIRKIRAKQPPLVDISEIKQAPATEFATQPAPPAASVTQAPAQVKDSPKSKQLEKQVERTFSFPPGLVGEIAEFSMKYAVRPVPEIALAAGIALVAGIAGRSYNVSNTGLNQYLILLARTGSGKEAIAQTVDALISTVRMKVPMADQFIGPAAFASGQGLIKSLDAAPCFVSVLGEVGITLQQISSPRANAADKMTEKVLLDLYGKSGWHQTLRSTVYSDKEKNTRIVQAPNLTIVGESTPDKFYDGLSAELVASGLIPRFLIMEYDGPRPRKNPQPFSPPSDILVQKLADLCSIAVSTQQNATCAPVQMEPEARQVLDAFDTFVDDQFDGTSEAELQVWNRAHLKALKLAALVAVGMQPHAATITAEVARWAVEFIKQDVHRILRKFQTGDIGQGHSKQYATIIGLMDSYLSMSVSGRKNYKAPASVVDKQIVPLAFLTTRVRRLKEFNAGGHQSPRQLLEKVLNEMVEEEVITRLPLDQALAEFKTRMPLYTAGVQWSGSLANRRQGA